MPVNLASGQQSFTSNVFLVPGDRTVLVDTGDGFDAVGAIEGRNEHPDAVVLTHTHPDHVGNVEAVVAAFDADVWGFDGDHPLVDRTIDDGDRVRLGDHEYRALHTPGHADDHLCLYASGPGILFSGDLVFADGAFGRTDLPEGDRNALVRSIDHLLETVGEDLAGMYPGHGPSVRADPYDHIVRAREAATTGA